MNGREDNKKTTSNIPSISDYQKQLYSLANGTFIGLLGRGLTWPLEYTMYESAKKKNTKPLSKIYAEVFDFKFLYKLNHSFLNAGLTQTIGKSMANIGVLHYVDCHHSHLTPVQKGLFAACISAPFETLVTSRGEFRKIQSFHHPQLHTERMKTLLPTGFDVVLAANFTRNLSTSIITFVGIYQFTESLASLFPSNVAANPLMKGLFACVANIPIQPLNMPFLNFQTYALLHTDKPFIKIVESFYKENRANPRDFFKGTSARIVHRGVYYGITFMATAYLKERERHQNKDEPSAGFQAKPR